jgi:hypothetical protein
MKRTVQLLSASAQEVFSLVGAGLNANASEVIQMRSIDIIRLIGTSDEPFSFKKRPKTFIPIGSTTGSCASRQSGRLDTNHQKSAIRGNSTECYVPLHLVQVNNHPQDSGLHMPQTYD